MNLRNKVCVFECFFADYPTLVSKIPPTISVVKTITKNKMKVEWNEFNIEVYEEHCNVLNIWLRNYDEKYPKYKYRNIKEVLSKQVGSEYHGWLIILGICLVHEKGLENLDNVFVEDRISSLRPDLYSFEHRCVVEAGSVGNYGLESRAYNILWDMIDSKDFNITWLNSWKFIHITKDVLNQKVFEEERRFEPSENPVCRIIKPFRVNLELNKFDFGYSVPGWGNITEDKKPNRYDSDSNKSYL